MNNSRSLQQPGKPPVVLIAGPTASGKSALAMAVAERWNGTVINADASQVYRDLRLLSARPSAADEGRVPHRLFGYVDGAVVSSAADWAADARREVLAAHAAGRLPVLVGGTGMYLRTLLDGIAPVPEINPDIRAEVRTLTVPEAYAALERADPQMAAKLRPSDTTRIMRALEVNRSTGRSLLDWQADRVGGIADQITLSPLILLPDRSWLYARIDARLATMFAEGAREEVAALLLRPDIPANAPVRRAIGVAEIGRWIAGDCDEASALAGAQLATRQYAKRQYTWFRNQPPNDWLHTTSIDSIDLANIFGIK